MDNLPEEKQPETKPEPEPVDILNDPGFDSDLFTAAPKWHESEREVPPERVDDGTCLCNYYPVACTKVGTSYCNKQCDRHPENFIWDKHVQEVFEKEPWSNYCFDCGEFVPSRNHEPALEQPGIAYSHTVATGIQEYRTKNSEWVRKRLLGKDV